MNVLAVGSHFDDIELGCSGTLAKHVKNGDKVVMAVLTDSEFSKADGTVIRSAKTALAEGREAAGIIGAELVTLGYKTFRVPFADELSVQLIGLIQEHEIDTVYTHWSRDVHRDHQAAAQGTLMAARHVPRFLMYRSNYYDSDETFVGNFYSDISDFIDVKEAAIRAHASEMERINYTWLHFIKNQDANAGMKINTDFAETFQVVRYLI